MPPAAAAAPSPLVRFHRWLGHAPASTRLGALAALTVLPVLAVTAAALADLNDTYAAMIGAPAGAALYLAVTGWWATTAPAALRTRAAVLRERLTSGQVRAAAATAAVMFVVLLLIAGPHLPTIVPGTAVVTVTLLLWPLLRPTFGGSITGETHPADEKAEDA